MIALEAGLVKGDPIGSQLIHEVNSLIADLALLQRPAERSHQALDLADDSQIHRHFLQISKTRSTTTRIDNKIADLTLSSFQYQTRFKKRKGKRGLCAFCREQRKQMEEKAK